MKVRPFLALPRRVVSHASARVAATLARREMRGWAPFSHLFITAEPGWALETEARALAGIAGHTGISVAPSRMLSVAACQSVFHTSQFVMLNDAWKRSSMRVGFAYYHGLPGSGIAEFDDVYRVLKAQHSRITRIQVSHTAMRSVVLDTGIDAAKVFLIPIGFDAALFPAVTSESRTAVRTELGLPASAVVLGSFQKDGVGWKEGLEPKLIKGPDVFLRAVERVFRDVPDLHVLLTGPARGYVKAGLASLGVPYTHIEVAAYQGIPRLYHALDVYVVASRQEGGPKAVLEAMSSGVPLVTTRVGQAMDLVQHGVNGWMVDVEDAEGLAYWVEHAISDSAARRAVMAAGRRTAEVNSYEAQVPLWLQFFDGFVETQG